MPQPSKSQKFLVFITKSIKLYGLFMVFMSSLILSPKILNAAGLKTLKSITANDLFTGQSKTITLEGKDKGLAVLFLSAKCPCSQSHEGLLKKMAQDFKSIKFVGLHSNQDEPVAITKEHFQKVDLGFPLLQDHKAKWADDLKALKTLHVFVFNSIGDLVYAGGVTNSHIALTASKNFLKDVLTTLQNGEKIGFREEKSLGCMISRHE
jgi:hypothetical protein